MMPYQDRRILSEKLRIWVEIYKEKGQKELVPKEKVLLTKIRSLRLNNF